MKKILLKLGLGFRVLSFGLSSLIGGGLDTDDV